MFFVARKVLALLSPKERKHSYLLLGMILVMAFLDVVGIASIMPFMAVLANPDIVQTNRWLNEVYTGLEFNDPQRFLFFLGIVVFVALVVSIVFRAATTWAITHFSQMRNYSIACRLVAGYLAQPYEWFLSHHSAELGKAVLSEVQQVVASALMPIMRLLAQGAVVVAILILLVVVDPMLALVVGGAMGGAYGAIYVVLRNTLQRLGHDRVAADEARFKVVSESFGGIKAVKLAGLEQIALVRFDTAAKRFAVTQRTAQVVALLPRFLMEIVAFGGSLLLVLFLMRQAYGLQGALPKIALYALAGYRMMPALQMAYADATILRFAGPALDRLDRDLREAGISQKLDRSSASIIVPRNEIRLDDVTYAYPNSDTPAIEGLRLTIAAQTTVGFVGETGSGKTTTVDIILGLLNPQSGSIRVDGTVISKENRREWQSALGYVPQHIFLSDETVAANIAFGAPNEEIDKELVERAAGIANLHEFVVNELPNGYDTIVGERGIRLSGGQRQRIGIARALYHKPKVLIFDEATSALDNLTEQAVMDAVHNLEGEVTIILIAHRLSTVRECDRIFLLDHGRLIGEGTYNELKVSSSRFRAMAGARS